MQYHWMDTHRQIEKLSTELLEIEQWSSLATRLPVEFTDSDTQSIFIVNLSCREKFALEIASVSLA